jgi:endosialidase-like protein
MKSHESLAWGLITASVFGCLQTAALGQTASDGRNESKLATITASGSSVRWKLAAPYSAVTLTVSAQDGRVFRREFKAGASPEFTITDSERKTLPDGQYTYELRLTPVLSPQAKRALAAARGRDTDPEAVRAARKPAAPTQPLVESGSFSILKGTVVVAGEVESESKRPRADATTAAARTPSRPYLSPVALRTSTLVPDDVIADDLIVQGSACVGLDCVNNESFGFDTIRVKENNTRIQFDDTSTSAGFPTNNWQIRANDSASGGASFLAFVDQGASGNSETGTIVLAVDAGAPANALKVSSTGRIGVRTATPVMDLHIVKSDTPAHRLEQTSAGGFTAQTWDIAGNEANFFVRDVTGGSRLPFRIRPGAPTSSIDISAAGNVGVGTTNPNAKVSVFGGSSYINFGELGGSSSYSGIAFGNSSATVSAANYSIVGNGTSTLLNRPTGGTIEFRENNAVQMMILSGGNVGIGTPAPTDMLSVNGNASKPGGGSWAVFSDRRLKTVKGNFNPGLSAVMQLQPLRYEYRRDNALKLPSDSEHIGFEAQAVQKIIPEAVTMNGNGYLQIDNDPILWTMLNAIKEQQAQIQKLQEEVRQLRTVSRRDNK